MRFGNLSRKGKKRKLINSLAISVNYQISWFRIFLDQNDIIFDIMIHLMLKPNHLYQLYKDLPLV